MGLVAVVGPMMVVAGTSTLLIVIPVGLVAIALPGTGGEVGLVDGCLVVRLIAILGVGVVVGVNKGERIAGQDVTEGTLWTTGCCSELLCVCRSPVAWPIVWCKATLSWFAPACNASIPPLRRPEAVMANGGWMPRRSGIEFLGDGG